MKRVEHQLWQETEALEVVVTHDNPLDLDQSTTIIKVSEDGIWLYFYLNGDLNGIITMTYDEWFEFANTRPGMPDTGESDKELT